jgi:hypothetical protein
MANTVVGDARLQSQRQNTNNAPLSPFGLLFNFEEEDQRGQKVNRLCKVEKEGSLYLVFTVTGCLRNW